MELTTGIGKSPEPPNFLGCVATMTLLPTSIADRAEESGKASELTPSLDIERREVAKAS